MAISETPGKNVMLDRVWSMTLLSLPIIISRIGFLLLSAVDMAMVGHYDTNALAAIAIAHAIIDTFMLVCAGALYGIIVCSSMAVGEGKPHEAGAHLRRGAIYAVGIGILASLAAYLFSFSLGVFGFEEQLAADIRALMFLLIPGLVPVLVHIAYSFFLEGVSRPLAATIVVLAANVLNLMLNYALVFGVWGAPELGAEGSAISTTAVRFVLAIALIVFVHFMFSERGTYHVNRAVKWAWSSWSMMRQIGYGGGLSFGLEAGAYMGIALMAGKISPLAAATMAVLINVRSVLLMIPMGIGFATSIQVGMGYGAKDADEINQATWCGLAFSIALTALLGAALMVWPAELIGIYTADEVLIGVAVGTATLLALALIMDAWQATMASALRGREDAIVPMVFHGIAFVIVMLPVAWLLGAWAGLGVVGLFQAIVVGNVIASLLMTARHFHLNAKTS